MTDYSTRVWLHRLDAPALARRIATMGRSIWSYDEHGDLAIVHTDAPLLLDPEADPQHGPMLIVDECHGYADQAPAHWGTAYGPGTADGEVCLVAPDGRLDGDPPDPYTIVLDVVDRLGRPHVALDPAVVGYLAARDALAALRPRPTPCAPDETAHYRCEAPL